MATELNLDDLEIITAIQSKLSSLMGEDDESFAIAHTLEWAFAKYPKFSRREIRAAVRMGRNEYIRQLRADGHG